MPDEAEIDVHADREEENPEQEPAEWIDHRLDGPPVLGFRQQQPGDEGAKRHRQASIGGDHARADRDQQGGGHEELRIVGAGGQAEQRLQGQTTDHGDQTDGKHRFVNATTRPSNHGGLLLVAAERADQEQQRHHGQVLGEQDGETGAAGGRHHAALARQKLHDDGGGRQREAGADDQRRGGRLAQPQRAEADHQAAVTRICSPPSPNTSRRMVSRRRTDSSSPMKNSRKTMPRSAMKAICFSPVTVSQSMARECLGEAAEAVRAQRRRRRRGNRGSD